MLDQTAISCPYCGETIDLLLDASAGSQTYYEDCSVCCRPINVHMEVDLDGEITQIRTLRDDESG